MTSDILRQAAEALVAQRRAAQGPWQSYTRRLDPLEVEKEIIEAAFARVGQEVKKLTRKET